MARPENHEDLDDWTRKGHIVATVHSEHLTRFPSLGMRLLAALAEAERLGLTLQDGEITIPPTAEELDKKLETHQRSWDYNLARWQRLVAGEELKDWEHTAAIDWAKTEGLDVPEDVTA